MKQASLKKVSLETPDEAERLAGESDVLALVRFGGARHAGDDDSPWIRTGLAPLGNGAAPVQCWRADAPVRRKRQGRFSVRCAPGLAMVAATLPDGDDPAPVASEAYRELFALARRLDCPHILRVWQYLPRITQPCADENRYKRFSAGRRLAFAAAGRSDTALPAACLLGDDADSILLYALLAEAPGLQVENPRQVSAFRYPREHGRAAPSFSRALAKRWPDGSAQLFISGTASVVGHASAHADTREQLGESLANLEALLSAGGVAPGADGPLASISPLKVYLRRPADFPLVSDALSRRLPAGHPVLYLRADVCRPELLVEIEGTAPVATFPPPRPSLE